MWRGVRIVGVGVGGVLLGAAANGLIVNWGGRIIPLPGGGGTLEELVAAAPLMTPKHFLFPWLAHALGTGAAAFVIARWVQAQRPLIWGLIPGVMFLAGGVWMALLVPAPAWFLVADLGLAYLPMAWMGANWGVNCSRRRGKELDSGEQ